MNRNLRISFAIMLGSLASAYGMNLQPNNLTQESSAEMTSVVSSENNTVQNSITAASQHANTDVIGSTGNVREETVHLQIIPENFSLLNENGLQMIDREVNSAYRNLSKWQHERLRYLAENGQFDAYRGFIRFWHVIESWTYPAAGLAQLVNTVLPLVVITKGDKLWLEIAMCVSGVLGLFFGQISVYAGTRISEQTAIHDILQVLRRRPPARAGRHSIDDQRDPLNNSASADPSMEEAYMGDNA